MNAKWYRLAALLTFVMYGFIRVGAEYFQLSFEVYLIVFILMIAGVLFVHKLQAQMKNAWPKIRGFLEHDGWILDLETSPAHIRPKHLLHVGGMAKTVVHVYSRTPQPVPEERWFVHEEYYQRGKYGLHLAQTLVYLVFRLPGSVPGWVRILPEEQFMFKLKPDFDLESHQFNQQVSMQAEPEKIGPLVMSPTFMHWYMELPFKPWVHIEDNLCCLSLGWSPAYEQIQSLKEMSREIIPLMQRSGALMPVSKKHA